MANLDEALKRLNAEEKIELENLIYLAIEDPDVFEDMEEEDDLTDLAKEVMKEGAFIVKVDWPIDWKERHVNFSDFKAPEGTGPDFTIGDTQVFILKPNEKIRWHHTRHERYAYGPSAMLVSMNISGLNQTEYDLHDMRVWDFIRLAPK